MSFWSRPPDLPPLETHFFEVLREVGGWGGGTPPFFGSKIMNLLVFFSILSRKGVSGSRLHVVCMGRSGTSANAVYAHFCHFCCVGGFGDLGDPVVPTLRGVSGDVVIVYAYWDTKGRFLQSLASLTAGHNPCQKREMAVSTNNGLVNGPVHNLLLQFFTLGSSKIEVFASFFFIL